MNILLLLFTVVPAPSPCNNELSDREEERKEKASHNASDNIFMQLEEKKRGRVVVTPKKSTRRHKNSAAKIAQSTRSKYKAQHHVDTKLSSDHGNYYDDMEEDHVYFYKEDDVDDYDLWDFPTESCVPCRNSAEAWTLLTLPKEKLLQIHEDLFGRFPSLTYIRRST